MTVLKTSKYRNWNKWLQEKYKNRKKVLSFYLFNIFIEENIIKNSRRRGRNWKLVYWIRFIHDIAFAVLSEIEMNKNFYLSYTFLAVMSFDIFSPIGLLYFALCWCVVSAGYMWIWLAYSQLSLHTRHWLDVASLI